MCLDLSRPARQQTLPSRTSSMCSTAISTLKVSTPSTSSRARAASHSNSCREVVHAWLASRPTATTIPSSHSALRNWAPMYAPLSVAMYSDSSNRADSSLISSLPTLPTPSRNCHRFPTWFSLRTYWHPMVYSSSSMARTTTSHPTHISWSTAHTAVWILVYSDDLDHKSTCCIVKYVN